jgi:hypothetical protein
VLALPLILVVLAIFALMLVGVGCALIFIIDRDAGLANVFTTLVVDSVPTGKWSVEQLALEETEGLSHSAAYSSMQAIDRIVAWLRVSLSKAGSQ